MKIPVLNFDTDKLTKPILLLGIGMLGFMVGLLLGFLLAIAIGISALISGFLAGILFVEFVNLIQIRRLRPKKVPEKKRPAPDKEKTFDKEAEEL